MVLRVSAVWADRQLEYMAERGRQDDERDAVLREKVPYNCLHDGICIHAYTCICVRHMHHSSKV